MKFKKSGNPDADRRMDRYCKNGSNLSILHEFFNRSKISKYDILKVGVNRSGRCHNYSMLHEFFEMSNIQVLDTPQTLHSESSNTNLTLFFVDSIL